MENTEKDLKLHRIIGWAIGVFATTEGSPPSTAFLIFR